MSARRARMFTKTRSQRFARSCRFRRPSGGLGIWWTRFQARTGSPSRVERYGSRATVSFESLHIRIPLKFCQNSAKLSQFFRNSENFRTSQHFLDFFFRAQPFEENSRKDQDSLAEEGTTENASYREKATEKGARPPKGQMN